MCGRRPILTLPCFAGSSWSLGNFYLEISSSRLSQSYKLALEDFSRRPRRLFGFSNLISLGFVLNTPPTSRVTRLRSYRTRLPSRHALTYVRTAHAVRWGVCFETSLAGGDVLPKGSRLLPQRRHPNSVKFFESS